MKLLIVCLTLFSKLSYSQTVKMFSKTVNVYVVTDMYLNPIEQATKVNARADFYWDKTTNSGVVKVTDLAHGKVYKYPVNQMYTGVAKGLKIYYFQTSDGKEKISVSKEENGFAFAHYSDITITVYGNDWPKTNNISKKENPENTAVSKEKQTIINDIKTLLVNNSEVLPNGKKCYIGSYNEKRNIININGFKVTLDASYLVYEGNSSHCASFTCTNEKSCIPNPDGQLIYTFCVPFQTKQSALNFIELINKLKNE